MQSNKEQYILFLEEDDDLRRAFPASLNVLLRDEPRLSHIRVLWASSVEEATRFFGDRCDGICLMAVDQNTGAGKHVFNNIIPFVQEVRRAGWQGPIIATATYRQDLKNLVEAGCDPTLAILEKRLVLPLVIETLLKMLEPSS